MARLLHASYSGYFPFCIAKEIDNDPDIGNKKQFPWGIPLNDLMAIYWRVKKWKIIGTNKGDVFLDKIVEPLRYSKKTGSQYVATSEEEIVCGDLMDIGAYADPNDKLANTIFFRFGWTLGFFDPNIKMKRNNDLYYPRFNLEAFYQNRTDEGGILDYGEAISPATSYYDVALVDSGTITIEALDFSYIIPTFKIIDNSSYGNGFIKAEEYWSYGGKYNTATGHPL